MTSISSIPPDRADRAFEEFFSATYRTRHASETPFWLGEQAMSILGLGESLTPVAFRNLLQGRTPDGTRDLLATMDPSRPCAWHWQHVAPGSVSALWALGPSHIQRLISDAHTSAVTDDALGLEQHMTGYPVEQSENDTSHHLFACFPENVSNARSPQLNTHVVLINAASWLDGKVEPISKENQTEIESPRDSYFYWLSMYFRVNFGEFRVQDFGKPNYQIIGVPHELYQADQGAHRQNPVLCADGEAVSRGELFDCWRKQALAFGWSCDEAKALTRLIQRERALRDRNPDESRSRNLRWLIEREKKIQRMTDRLLIQMMERQKARRQNQSQPINTSHGLANTAEATMRSQWAVPQPQRPNRSVAPRHTPSARPRIKI